jgi:uncharacterized protein (TIGR03663 family)
MEKILAAAVLLTALLFRLWALDEKPLHFDEGVNGNFVDRMVAEGFYHYDPTNYHGPLHFYALFVFQTLLGREPWVLRLPTALLSTASVGLVLAFRSTIGRKAALVSAFAMAVSPGLVFYGRYAIHESWLVFFLLLTFWGLAGLHRGKQRAPLWAIGMGICGMLLTKETHLLHLAAMGLAVPTLRLLERFSPSAPSTHPVPQAPWTRKDMAGLLATCGGLLIFFYSGGLLDGAGLSGFFESFLAWARTGTGGESGHEKPWPYWLELLLRYEWPALVGLAASVFVLLPGIQRPLRYLAVYAGGTLVAYSIVPYKTPWCVISMLWPWLLLFGVAVAHLAARGDRWCVHAGAGLILAYSTGMSGLLNFRSATDEEEPYVYVQTLPEIRDLLDPLRNATRQNPQLLHATGYVLLPELFPWTWLLGRHSRVAYLNPPDFPEELESPEFALVDTTLLETFEARLTEPYFKQPLHVRGSSPDDCFLFLRASTFTPQFPGRDPEFVPEPPAPGPEEAPPQESSGSVNAAPDAALLPSAATPAIENLPGPRPIPPLPILDPKTGELVPDP